MSEWKPGPPPLDRDGFYVCSFAKVLREVEVRLRGYWDDRGDEMSRHWLERCDWHYGPIPDPPASQPS